MPPLRASCHVNVLLVGSRDGIGWFTKLGDAEGTSTELLGYLFTPSVPQRNPSGRCEDANLVDSFAEPAGDND